MSQLAFRYRYDESFFDERLDRDDFGWLTLSVETDQFSGTGGFWVQWQNVRAFGESLSVFPIPPDEPLTEGWYLGGELILGVSIGPANMTGDLLVRVEIADQHDLSRRVCTSFLTNYPDIEAFRLSIADLMDRKIEEAFLCGR